MNASKQTLQAALQYASYQWSVIPVQPREKRPMIRWQEFQHRPATEEEIEGWFKRRPDANVAVVTGKISGVVVIDIDPRDGGEASMASWVEQYGELPETVESKTGGGGRHLYFVHPGGEIHNRVGIVDGIDFRGDGGCIVTPPSIHSSGKAYTWRKGHAPGEIELAELPGWLLELIRK